MSAQVCLVPLLRMDEGAIFSCSSRGQTCIPALKSSNQHLENLLRDRISNCGMQNHIRIGKSRKPIPMPDVESSNRSGVGAVHENAIEGVRDCIAPRPDAKSLPPARNSLGSAIPWHSRFEAASALLTAFQTLPLWVDPWSPQFVSQPPKTFHPALPSNWTCRKVSRSASASS